MKNIKNLKKTALIFIGVATLFAVYCYTHGMPSFSRTRTISVSGVCNTKVQKDKFAITLQIKTLDKNAAVSLKNAQKAADGVAKRIKGIDDKTLEIQTTRISSYEKTKWVKDTSVSLGTESQIDLEIITEIKETIDTVLNSVAGITNAEVLPHGMKNFSSKGVIDGAVAKCLESAITDARNKAAAIAAGDGEKLGRLIKANFGAGWSGDDEVGFNESVAQFRVQAARSTGFAAADSADYVQSSDGDLSITVGAVFRIR